MSCCCPPEASVKKIGSAYLARRYVTTLLNFLMSELQPKENFLVDNEKFRAFNFGYMFSKYCLLVYERLERQSADQDALWTFHPDDTPMMIGVFKKKVIIQGEGRKKRKLRSIFSVDVFPRFRRTARTGLEEQKFSLPIKSSKCSYCRLR